MKNRGFTLIELLVVITTITLLSSIVLVALRGAREKAQITKTLQWARSIKAQLGGDIVGDWNFNEGSGNKVIDATGYNTGTLGNGTCAPGSGSCPSWTDGVQGLTGKALYFDGGDYVNVGISPSFNLTQLTMELWIKTPPSMGATWRNVLSKTGVDRDFGFWMRSSNNIKVDGLHQSSARFGSWVAFISTPFEPETWHHVVMTIDSSGLQKAYADGKLISQYQGTSGNANNSYPVWIGRSDNYWYGSIDEVRIYNRALTAMEIQKHYAEGLEKYQNIVKK